MPVKKPEVMKMLGLTDLFGGLRTESKRMVSGIAIPRRLEKGECLMAEGESGGALFLLGSGSIKLTKQGPDIKEVTVKIVSEGEIFGEVVLFEDDKYPVTGTAIKRSTVFILPREQFYCLLEHRGFRDDFFKLLIAKQRYLANRLKYFQLNDLEKRFFLFLRERYGEKDEIK
ncbi:MAG: Crp/Fnr family transcriptional regulator, partial [Chitinivibrionales bacterium]